LRQLANDHRSVAMIVLVPSLIITLMYFMFQNVPHRPGTPSPFNNACLILLGLLPLAIMFLITSISMQRERVSGTLERILTTPLRRLDLLAAYGTAFSVAAAAQATVACVVALLSGIIVPRALLPEWLHWISNVMPASYALEALQQVGAYPNLTAIAVRDIAVVVGCAIIALCLAAATLRRRTP
jgi:ABC-2 type transport system permease protein